MVAGIQRARCSSGCGWITTSVTAAAANRNDEEGRPFRGLGEAEIEPAAITARTNGEEAGKNGALAAAGADASEAGLEWRWQALGH
jgi:hypothetical protein